MNTKKARLFRSAITIILCCASARPHAPGSSDSTKLLGDVIRAYGGQKVLDCKSAVLGVVAILDPKTGQQSNGRIFIKPDRFRLEYDMGPNHKYRMGYDGTQAWLIASPTAKAPKKLDLLQVRLFQFYSLALSFRWLEYLKEHSNDLKYLGPESFRGAKSKTLQANVETIGNVDFLIDSETRMLNGIRFVFPGENQPRYEFVYNSYFDHKGIKVPGYIAIFRNDLPYREYQIKDVRLCEDIADTVFGPDIK